MSVFVFYLLPLNPVPCLGARMTVSFPQGFPTRELPDSTQALSLPGLRWPLASSFPSHSSRAPMSPRL